MEQFKTDGRRINQHMIEQMHDEYRTLLMEYRKKYINQILDIVAYRI